MSNDEREREQLRPRRPGFRLTLRSTLAVLIAAICIWLGMKLARGHRADEALARHDAVLDVIIANLANPPAGTTFRDHPGDPAELERLLGRTHPDGTTRKDAILEFGSPQKAVTAAVVLDVQELLADESVTAEQVASRLVDHYSSGLTGAGLQRIVSGGGKDSIAIWKSPDGELDVWIDSTVDMNAKTADVRVIFIDSQRL